MPRAPLVAMAAFALSLSAPTALPVSAEVAPTVLQEIKEAADAAFKAANPPKPEKTPEQIEAEKQSIKSHCDALRARAAERNSELPGSCD